MAHCSSSLQDFSPPGLTPQFQISEVPLDAHRHLLLHEAQLELTTFFFRFLLRIFLAESERLPSESLWTHLMGSWLFLDISAPS